MLHGVRAQIVRFAAQRVGIHNIPTSYYIKLLHMLLYCNISSSHFSRFSLGTYLMHEIDLCLPWTERSLR
jgi:hypothetical protein